MDFTNEPSSVVTGFTFNVNSGTLSALLAQLSGAEKPVPVRLAQTVRDNTVAILATKRKHAGRIEVGQLFGIAKNPLSTPFADPFKPETRDGEPNVIAHLDEFTGYLRVTDVCGRFLLAERYPETSFRESIAGAFAGMFGGRLRLPDSLTSESRLVPVDAENANYGFLLSE